MLQLRKMNRAPAKIILRLSGRSNTVSASVPGTVTLSTGFLMQMACNKNSNNSTSEQNRSFVVNCYHLLIFIIFYYICIYLYIFK